MKTNLPLHSLAVLAALAVLPSGCALFQSDCKCEEIRAEQYVCPSGAAPVLAANTLPEKDTALSGALVGDIEPSSALETDGKVAAVAEIPSDNHSDDAYDDETIDDEFDPQDEGELPSGITASQMDQILPSQSARERIDIPDSARNPIQIPVLTSVISSDSNWRSEVAPYARDLSQKADSDSGLRALSGNFLTRYSGKSAAIVTPADKIEIYTPGRPTMRRDTTLDYRLPVLSTLWPHPMYAAQLVEDEPLEFVVIGINKEGDNDQVLMNVYKVFGDRLGRIFQTEIGIVSDDKIIKTAQIEFVSGKNDIGIRRTPIDSKGNPDKANSVVYDWNHWEGAYRENTAPERERLGPPNWANSKESDKIAEP